MAAADRASCRSISTRFRVTTSCPRRAKRGANDRDLVGSEHVVKSVRKFLIPISARVYRGLEDLTYPFHDGTVR